MHNGWKKRVGNDIKQTKREFLFISSTFTVLAITMFPRLTPCGQKAPGYSPLPLPLCWLHFVVTLFPGGVEIRTSGGVGGGGGGDVSGGGGGVIMCDVVV